VRHLVELNDASRFRENLLTPTTLVVVLLLCSSPRARRVVIAGGRSRRWNQVLAAMALVDLALLPASYVGAASRSRTSASARTGRSSSASA